MWRIRIIFFIFLLLAYKVPGHAGVGLIKARMDQGSVLNRIENRTTSDTNHTTISWKEPDTIGTINAKKAGWIRIDSIRIIKNWRTRDHIILCELEFREGDLVTSGKIDSSMIKIYNIGNFARVQYEIDTLGKGKNLLTITAKDAFTVVPILSFSGSRKDWQLGMGFSDNNFLGRNIGLSLQGTIGTRDKNFSLQFNIPRQLMYRNMSIGGGILYGNSRNYTYEDGQPVSGIGYKRKEIYGNIANPWHEDFTYRFSPNIGWRLFQHKTDSTLIASDIPPQEDYSINYLAFSISESIGYIQNIKHQQRGYEAHLGIGVGIGLNSNSPAYFSVGGGASYHKLLNQVIQWSTKFSTSFTSTDIPSLMHYMGGDQIKGIITGEIYGKAVYYGSTGFYFTYLNKDWFAIEQSVYLNIGNGRMVYTDLFRTKPVASIGTGFKLWIPMIPWLYVKVFFTYSKNRSNWFQLQF